MEIPSDHICDVAGKRIDITMRNRRINLKTGIIGVVAGLTLFWGSCIPGKYLKVADSSGVHQHIRLKFFFQDAEKKQNGKILLKFERNRARILFLSSLNQVYFELFVRDDEAWLINTRKKSYWTGAFSRLIADWWNVKLTLDELTGLLTRGRIAEKKLKSTGFRMSLQRDPINGEPRKIRLFDDVTIIVLKIQHRSQRQGRILIDRDFSALSKCDLDVVLSWE